MRSNPRGDWRIEDLLRVAERVGLAVRPPSSGSHYVVASGLVMRDLAIPYHRPIKDVYVRRFVLLVDDHVKAGDGDANA